MKLEIFQTLAFVKKVLTLFFERSEPSERAAAASEVREAILPETTKKNLAPVPNFGEGGGQPKAG